MHRVELLVSQTGIGFLLLSWFQLLSTSHGYQRLDQDASALVLRVRNFWGTVYALAIGATYGAFALSFSASLAGLLWRKDLAEKGVRVRRLEFARVNLPLIIFCMVVSCAILIGDIYVVRDNTPHSIRS
jgi:Na+/H+ antiporter NhaD/arsenite permease-like protein